MTKLITLQGSAARTTRLRLVASCLMALSVLSLISGCAKAAPSETQNPEATGTVKGHGVVVDVHITPEMLNSKPAPPELTTPEAAVRSYLDWISYAYRIGDSNVATPAMSPLEEVRVNSYVQYNLQEHNRLIDQTLKSITFGKSVSKSTTVTIVPAQEKWTYKWVSAAVAGKVVGGPFNAEYVTSYKVIRNDVGLWLVDHVDADQVGKD